MEQAFDIGKVIEYESELIKAATKELEANIQKGIDFVNKSS